MYYEAISADNHFNEPGDVFLPRVPAKYKDRAPRIVPTPDGGENWLWEGQGPKQGFGLASAVWARGRPRGPRDYIFSGLKLAEVAPGSWDSKAAIEEMKKDGVDAAVYYPSLGTNLFGITDKEFRLILFRAYNDWQLDWCSRDPNRLVTMALLPVAEETPAEAVAEIGRCLKMGFKAVQVPCYPTRRFWDRWWDPIFAAAEEANVSVNFHKGVGAAPTFGTFGNREGPGMWFSGQVQSDFMYSQPIGDFLFGQVFERYPKLKIVSGEGRIGWLIHWVQRADESYHRHRYWTNYTLSKLPSEILKSNVYSTFIEDRMGVLMREYIGVDNNMWSSDYPHSDSTWPNSRQKIEVQFAGVPEGDKRKMLALNAAGLYHLPADEFMKAKTKAGSR